VGADNKCPICKEWMKLTEHHAYELGPNSSGVWTKISICDDCHKVHEKYVNMLTARYEYDPKKTKHHEYLEKNLD